jgi:hypothetical protein
MAEKNDTVLEQTRIDIVGALTATRLLNYHRHDAHNPQVLNGDRAGDDFSPRHKILTTLQKTGNLKARLATLSSA